MRVLYFTISNFAPSDRRNGGEMYTKNLIQRLSDDDGIELFVLNATDPQSREESERWFAEKGIQYLYQPMNASFPFPRSRSLLEVGSFLKSVLFRFSYELEAYGQTHLAKAGLWAINHWKIDHVVFDSTIAPLFWRDIQNIPVPTTVITINREADFFKDLLSLGLTSHGPLTGKIAAARFARVERDIYKSASKVVAIGAPDLPSYLPANRKAVITSYFDTKSIRWSRGQNDKAIFFVGNIGHYPNRLAIDFIVRELAPRILREIPDVVFKIIGADESQIDGELHHPSIHLMGTATPQQVENLFLTASLFCVPIKNSFGMKFKVAEALSYGTPFIASKETMLGFPYLNGFPFLDLDNPADSAARITSMLRNPSEIKAVSENALEKQRNFAETQKNIWSRTLSS